MSNTNTTDHAAPYRNFFKGWHDKALGPKPGADLLATAHALGLRPGKQALALAMALRDVGVSGNQVVMTVGAPQNNKRRDLITAGLLRSVPMPGDAAGRTVYKVALTAKGEAKVKRANDAAAAGDTPATAKPAKGKGSKPAKGKPRKGKPAPAAGDAGKPASEPVNPAAGDATAAGNDAVTALRALLNDSSNPQSDATTA